MNTKPSPADVARVVEKHVKRTDPRSVNDPFYAITCNVAGKPYGWHTEHEPPRFFGSAEWYAEEDRLRVEAMPPRPNGPASIPTVYRAGVLLVDPDEEAEIEKRWLTAAARVGQDLDEFVAEQDPTPEDLVEKVKEAIAREQPPQLVEMWLPDEEPRFRGGR